MSQCKKFAPNIFHKTKCSSCFRQKEEHSTEALESNRASRSIARSGYLFVAPDWDFSVPLNRTKRWQRRWFVLYDDGELNYSVDEHPDTVPQGSVDMSKVLEVTGAEQITGHPHSLALTGPDRVTFVKAASREDARWWAELLAVFPRRHKRNATFPGGRASPSLPQLGRSASPQPPRARHLSCTGPSRRANFTTPSLKESRKAPESSKCQSNKEVPTSKVLKDSTIKWIIEPPSSRSDCIIVSGSPPTRDKQRHEEKVTMQQDWRNERFRNIASTMTDQSSEPSLMLPAERLLNIKKGWLWYKESHAKSEWLRRWWVLCEQTLCGYIEPDEESLPEISIDLSTITECNEVAVDSRYSFHIQWSGLTYVFSAVTSTTMHNWIQTLKRATLTNDSSSAPATLRSYLPSSDEEYRTASEGGRRDSEDWGDSVSPPEISNTAVQQLGNKTDLQLNVPRDKSEQTTIDAISTDELDSCKHQTLDMYTTSTKQVVDMEVLKKQLSNAVNEVRSLEADLIRYRSMESEHLAREQQRTEELKKLELSEIKLNLQVKHMNDKYNQEQKALRTRLIETEELVKKTEKKYLLVVVELQNKQEIMSNLQLRLDKLNENYNKIQEENCHLNKMIKELEEKQLNRKKRLDSVADLIDINRDIQLRNLDQTCLIEECLDLRNRLEAAVVEIKEMKKELRESHAKYDQLELKAVGLNTKLRMMEEEALAQSNLMADRVQDLTLKLAAAEKQARSLKLKLQGSREKRRSLSLKGRENFSINKEIEDKITELEVKILTIERGRSRRKHRREKSNEESPLPDDRSRSGRRKSLDSATSSEPMKLFMRLNNLEGKVMSVTNSNESLYSSSSKNYDMQTDKILDKHFCAESVILAAIERLNDCKEAFNLLKSQRNSIPHFNSLENRFSELGMILDLYNNNSKFNAISSSSYAMIRQLEIILREKISSLNDKRRMLAQQKQLDDKAKLEIFAEKVAFENIIVSRIQQAINTSSLEEDNDMKLYKESIETMNLICSLTGKLGGTVKKEIPTFYTGVDYLTKALTKRLIATSYGCTLNKEIKNSCRVILNYLEEEQTKVTNLINNYKLYKLPQLADALAIEAIRESIDVESKCYIKNIEEFWNLTSNHIHNKLMESEINYIMTRTAQLYEQKSNFDNQFVFSRFRSQRGALELWENLIELELQTHMDRNTEELTNMFKHSLNRLQKEHRQKIEIELPNIHELLSEFADVVSHKALIDSRIKILRSECEVIDKNECPCNSHTLLAFLQSDEQLNCFQQIGLVNVRDDLDAEFKSMLNQYKIQCEDALERNDLIEIKKSVQDLSLEMTDIMKHLNKDVLDEQPEIHNLHDIDYRCKLLKNQLFDIKQRVIHIKDNKRFDLNEDRQLLFLDAEYLHQKDNLRASYRRTLSKCENYRQQTYLEQLQLLFEHAFVSIEHCHLRIVNSLRDQHAHELQAVHREREQALAEETRATLAALDAMRKAHEAEVQREVARFKQDFAKHQQNEFVELAVQLSGKCSEATTNEDQLENASRTLTYAQKRILQLQNNPQFPRQK